MTPQSMLEQLIANALAEAQPVGQVLRASERPDAERAAAAAEAGRLEEGLRLAGFPADLARLGQQWPTALRPALDRLARIPPPRVFQAPLIQDAGFYILIASVQLVTVLLLQLKALPLLSEFTHTMGIAGHPNNFLALAAGYVLFIAIVVAVVYASFGRARTGGNFAVWTRHLTQAREAALATALHDSRAPETQRGAFMQSCQELRGEGATADELEAIFQYTLSAASAAHKRMLIIFRVSSYAVLILLAATATSGVYLTMSNYGVLQ